MRFRKVRKCSRSTYLPTYVGIRPLVVRIGQRPPKTPDKEQRAAMLRVAVQEYIADVRPCSERAA
jgi:hypothetical protein